MLIKSDDNMKGVYKLYKPYAKIMDAKFSLKRKTNLTLFCNLSIQLYSISAHLLYKITNFRIQFMIIR